jgi:hypothetical protein
MGFMKVRIAINVIPVILHAKLALDRLIINVILVKNSLKIVSFETISVSVR